MALAPTCGALGADTSVPVGVRVKWFQRAWELFVEIEGSEMESPEVSISDEGLILVHAKVAGVTQTVSLKLLHGVKSRECRFVLSKCALRRATSRPVIQYSTDVQVGIQYTECETGVDKIW